MIFTSLSICRCTKRETLFCSQWISQNSRYQNVQVKSHMNGLQSHMRVSRFVMSRKYVKHLQLVPFVELSTIHINNLYPMRLVNENSAKWRHGSAKMKFFFLKALFKPLKNTKDQTENVNLHQGLRYLSLFLTSNGCCMNWRLSPTRTFTNICFWCFLVKIVLSFCVLVNFQKLRRSSRWN